MRAYDAADDLYRPMPGNDKRTSDHEKWRENEFERRRNDRQGRTHDRRKRTNNVGSNGNERFDEIVIEQVQDPFYLTNLLSIPLFY